MSEKKVTILVPNYKTPEITKICLRLLRKYTNPDLADVIVIDNDSQDESLAYLRGLSWIRLIERDCMPGESGVQAHSRALDLALSEVDTPYVLSIHTDTFVRRSDWLEVLLSEFDSPEVGGVGSWKLETKNALKRFGIKLEQVCKYILHHTINYEGYNPERLNSEAQYLRSHCSMYRTDLINQLQTSFADGDNTAGKIMHSKMKNAGYAMKFLPSEYLSKYVLHLNHATSILNPSLRRSGKTSKKEMKKFQKKIARYVGNKDFIDDNLDV